MAIMVSTRLWLGAVVSTQRDSALVAQLAQLVRRWDKRLALLITFDGFAAYLSGMVGSENLPALSAALRH